MDILIEMYIARGYTILSQETNQVIARVNKPLKNFKSMADMIKILNTCINSPINLPYQNKDMLAIGKFFDSGINIKEWLVNNFTKYYIITIICTKNFSSIKKIETMTNHLIPNVEIFMDTDFSFNITKHIFQPHFELYTDDLMFFNKKKLPLLSSNDKICKFYKFQVGDLVKITDKDTGFVSIKLVK
ncbi:hypothetical protein AGMMS49579_03980 [Spirochaetia bacterium]|nr:hypothetical protein AGMMS49579_03980 [Spirochaetia bacterium]